MKPRAHNVLTVSTLSVLALTLTGWTGGLPSGVGAIVTVSLGLAGLAAFPSIAPVGIAEQIETGDDGESGSIAS